MKIIIFGFILAVISTVHSLEDSDLGIKPKRGLAFSLGYQNHHAPFYGHSYIAAPAPAAVVHHAPAIVHHSPSVYAAPIAHYHAPLVAHAPSYAYAAHAPVAVAHSPFLSHSLHHFKK